MILELIQSSLKLGSVTNDAADRFIALFLFTMLHPFSRLEAHQCAPHEHNRIDGLDRIRIYARGRTEPERKQDCTCYSNFRFHLCPLDS